MPSQDGHTRGLGPSSSPCIFITSAMDNGPLTVDFIVSYMASHGI